MARAKIKRGSTTVDMTAMCDVAFLLLTFFILATSFKPSEAVEVAPPSSVSNKPAPQKDFFNVTISRDNKVYIDMDENIRGNVLEQLGKERNIQFSPTDIELFKKAEYVPVPLSQLKQFIALTAEETKNMNLPGVPHDSTNNELSAWISAAKTVSMGGHLRFLVKGDNASKYSTFKDVVDAFKANDEYKYFLITNAAEVPEGSELWKKNQSRPEDKATD